MTSNKVEERSPSFVEARDGYETRLVQRLDSVLGDAKDVVADIVSAIASREEMLRLREENRLLRERAGDAAKDVVVVASTSGDLVRDVCRAVSVAMREMYGDRAPPGTNTFMSDSEAVGDPFIEAVRAVLKRPPSPSVPLVPKEAREP